MKTQIYQYYVEGEDEKSLINTLKSDMRCIAAGKVDVFYVVQNTFSSSRLRTLKNGTIVVLVYDTDVDNVDILRRNIKHLKSQRMIKDVFCIPQVENLEDALVDACDVNKAQDITHSKTKKDFKRDLIKCSNLDSRLKNCNFDVEKLWIKVPRNDFKEFGNDAEKIKQ